jgi:FixJ family two-component response regulator
MLDRVYSRLQGIGSLRDTPDDPRVISIVDDDLSVRDATRRLLRLQGYVVHTFASAEEFLRSTEAGDTCCLVADVRMSGMDGLALQQHLIARGCEIPIVFITAYPEEGSRERALSRGAVCFLNKPFYGEDLIRCVEQALGMSS